MPPLNSSRTVDMPLSVDLLVLSIVRSLERVKGSVGPNVPLLMELQILLKF